MQKFVESVAVADKGANARRRELKEKARELARHCAEYRKPSNGRAIWQIASTAVPFVLLLAVMIWLAERYFWMTALLGIPLGGLLVRFFIIQHDCGHGSFVTSRKWNDAIGRAVSVLTVTPYGLWRRIHAHHHAGSGNLDRRGGGDINTLTVREYQALSPLGRVRYRAYRNPIFLFFIGVPAFFVLLQRLPWGQPLPFRDAWRSVVGLDLTLCLLYGLATMLLSLKALATIVVPTLLVASVVGGWLFFIQHQFEDTHWDNADDWDFQVAAIHGSSFYDLPPVLNWFTGDIGLHHIHHLNSMIPNYRLRECLEASEELRSLNRLSLWQSLGCARLTLWDEDQRRLVGFKDINMPGSA